MTKILNNNNLEVQVNLSLFVMATRWRSSNQLGFKKRLHAIYSHYITCSFCLLNQPLKLKPTPPCVKCTQRYGSDGLKLVNHEETVSFGQAVLKLTFDPGSPDNGMLTAECRLDHPFFVKNKGAKWE